MSEKKPSRRNKGALDRFFKSDLFSTRDLWSMLVPVIADQLLIYVISMVTTSMISTSGQDSVSAVSLTTPLVYMANAIVMAVGAGGSVVIAQFKGHGDNNKLREAIGQTTWLCMTVSLLCNGLLALFAAPVISLLFPSAEAGVKSKALLYMLGMALCNFVHGPRIAVMSALRGIGRNKDNMYASLLINVSYFFFSFLFINLLKMDIYGTLLSYLLARILGLLHACFMLFMQKNGPIRTEPSKLVRLIKEYLKPIVHLALPFTVEDLFFNGGSILVSAYMVLLGTASVAAGAVITSVGNTLYAPIMAVGILATTVIGQCIGAARRDLAVFYTRRLIIVGYALALFFSLLLLPFLSLIIRLYHPSAEALIEIDRCLPLLLGGFVLLYPPSCILPYMLRAAGDAYYSTAVSMLGLWLMRVALGYVLSITVGLGLWGVWIATLAEWGLRLLLYSLRTHGKAWLSKKSATDD